VVYQHWQESDILPMMLVPHHSPTDELWYTLEYHPRFSDFAELEAHMAKHLPQ
jgi:hypothetical protein